MQSYDGACHCGAIIVTLHSAKSADQLGARTCQCSFCRKHGASWTSDSDGRIDIALSGPVSRYRFGTETADFLICGTCGVVPAVVDEIDGQLLSVVRVDCLDEASAFLEHSATMDLDGEILDARLDRRAQRWTPSMIEERG